MVNWSSQAEILHDQQVFINLMHGLLGLYAWEWATSLDFEWSILERRKRFRWPLIFYMLGRYSMLFALVGIVVSFNLTSQYEVNCQALYMFNSLFGNAAIGFASVNLALRTMAVWEQRWYIVSLLVVVMAGQWALLLRGTVVATQWVPGQGCVIIKTQSEVLAASFIYTMCFDLLVLCLTAYKLATTGGIARSQRSRLVNMIFQDGLIYFFIAFVANTISTTFMLLNLNGIMAIIFNVPSAVASTIVATRAVRRLSNFLNVEPERFGANKSSLAFRPNPRSGATSGSAPSGATGTVTVPMDTFTRASDPGFAEFAKEEGPDASTSDFDIESKGYGTQAI